MKYDIISGFEAVVNGAYFDIGRRRKLLVNVQKELLFGVEFHVLFEPVDYVVDVFGSFEEEFFLF